MKIDEAAHEIEVLERKVQNYVSDISNIEDQLSSKVLLHYLMSKISL